MISSTWMKPETPARTRVGFWRWRDARFLWTSSTLSGTWWNPVWTHSSCLSTLNQVWVVNLGVFSVQSQTMWRPQWRQLWSFMRQMKTGTSWHFSPGRSLAFSLILPLFHDPHESIRLLTFPLGWSGESGVAPAGAGQDSVETWHEETPQNLAHVLWSALPWPNEGLWEGPPHCSQGNLAVSEMSALL